MRGNNAKGDGERELLFHAEEKGCLANEAAAHLCAGLH